MSKKNNKTTKRNVHNVDIQREKEANAAKQKKAEKKRAALATKGGATLKKKVKGVRIRKGVTIKGIKVVDSESKKKLKKLLKARAAMNEMEVDK